MSDDPTVIVPTSPSSSGSKLDPENQPGGQQINWEGRYKGLQSTFEKLQKKFDTLNGQYEVVLGELEELRQGSKKWESDKAATAVTLAQFEKDKQALEAQLKTHAFNGERMKLIMAEFPDLAGFEAEGLLPTAESVEALKPKLVAFSTKIGGAVSSDVKRKLSGAGPVASGQSNVPTTHSSDYIYMRLTQLAGHRTPEQEAEYISLRDEWDQLNP